MPGRTLRIGLTTTLLCGLLAGCGSSGGRSNFEEPAPPAGPLGPGPGGEFAEAGAPAAGDVVGHLSGTVMAPNGTIPIAGAVLYLTDTKPAPAPEQVFCDVCVHLAAGTPYALSDDKGAFVLAPTKLGTQFLVLQKGGFRRVREITVSKGDAKVPSTLATLPPRTDLSLGDEVPRMTVVHGNYDEIEASLHKLGIANDAIDIVESALIGEAARSFLTDKARVDARHIVFLPCGDYTQPPPNTDISSEPSIQENLRSFVDAGGRLYVTDWHYDFIHKTFPGFIDWSGGSASPCSGCGHTSYDVAASVDDPGLASWMTAQSLTSFSLLRNYTSIDGVNPVATTDASGAPKTVTPRVWVSGSKAGKPKRPATVSFEHGCGRVLYSTYHTEPSSLDLTPQERALLGVLLEASVCNDSATGVVIK
jgi:hypothetical protein